jgi:hypothetical protein
MQRGGKDIGVMTPDQRRGEVARVLAAGVLRLHQRAALAGAPGKLPDSGKPTESSPNCLEVSRGTVLSVHTG